MSDPAVLQIICPVHFENENVRSLCGELWNKIPVPFKIRFVFDRSDDPTVPALEQLSRELENQGLCQEFAITQNKKKGVLWALRTGFDLAPKNGPVLVVMADLSDDLSLVPAMLSAWQNGAAVVVASRYMRGGQQIGGPFFKKLLSRLAGQSLYWLGKLPVQDATNNFRLYDAEFLNSLDIESQGGFEIALEITAKAMMQNKKIVEMPSVWRDRSAGKSKFKFSKWLPHYLKWYFFLLKNRVPSENGIVP